MGIFSKEIEGKQNKKKYQEKPLDLWDKTTFDKARARSETPQTEI
jgi:hypothetical protein